jgi:hypothetical protein
MNNEGANGAVAFFNDRVERIARTNKGPGGGKKSIRYECRCVALPLVLEAGLVLLEGQDGEGLGLWLELGLGLVIITL